MILSRIGNWIASWNYLHPQEDQVEDQVDYLQEDEEDVVDNQGEEEYLEGPDQSDR